MRGGFRLGEGERPGALAKADVALRAAVDLGFCIHIRDRHRVRGNGHIARSAQLDAAAHRDFRIAVRHAEAGTEQRALDFDRRIGDRVGLEHDIAAAHDRCVRTEVDSRVGELADDDERHVERVLVAGELLRQLAGDEIRGFIGELELVCDLAGEIEQRPVGEQRAQRARRGIENMVDRIGLVGQIRIGQELRLRLQRHVGALDGGAGAHQDFRAVGEHAFERQQFRGEKSRRAEAVLVLRHEGDVACLEYVGMCHVDLREQLGTSP